ncbi:MAG: glutathione S-transferase family protein [Limnobacter sp.]|nr:glutathione S-transferase family protein [Limnobacter sp.]
MNTKLAISKPERLLVHGLDLSYFTGKLEGYLRGKQIPYDLIEMDTADFKRCGKATGVAQMPQVEWTNGQWLTDTTLIIPFLDEQYPDTCVLPSQPLMRFIAQLLEDFGDEWLWRPALYYRWAKAKDARLMSHRLAEGMMRDVPLPFFMRRWAILNRQRLHFLLMDGYSVNTAPRIEAHYLETLDALEAIFQQQSFVLGNKPSLADYGFFGSMFRHFFCDPTPAGIMRSRAPAVHEWVARMWNLKLIDYAQLQFNGEVSDCTQGLFELVASEFIPYMQANEAALGDKKRNFIFSSKGVDMRLPVHNYRAWRFQRMRQRFQALDGSSQEKLQSLLGVKAIESLKQNVPVGTAREIHPPIKQLPIQQLPKKALLSKTKILSHQWK